MDWKTKTITLAHPITAQRFGKGEVLHRAITLHEPDTIALEEIDALGLKEGEDIPLTAIRAMIVALSGLPADQIGRMHRDDLTAFAEEITPLLAPGEAPAEADGSSSSA